MRRLISRTLCWFGIHGPAWFGNERCDRSGFIGPFRRRRMHCGAQWSGTQVFNGRVRTVGDWRRLK